MQLGSVLIDTVFYMRTATLVAVLISTDFLHAFVPAIRVFICSKLEILFSYNADISVLIVLLYDGDSIDRPPHKQRTFCVCL